MHTQHTFLLLTLLAVGKEAAPVSKSNIEQTTPTALSIIRDENWTNHDLKRRQYLSSYGSAIIDSTYNPVATSASFSGASVYTTDNTDYSTSNTDEFTSANNVQTAFSYSTQPVISQEVTQLDIPLASYTGIDLDHSMYLGANTDSAAELGMLGTNSESSYVPEARVDDDDYEDGMASYVDDYPDAFIPSDSNGNYIESGGYLTGQCGGRMYLAPDGELVLYSSEGVLLSTFAGTKSCEEGDDFAKYPCRMMFKDGYLYIGNYGIGQFIGTYFNTQSQSVGVRAILTPDAKFVIQDTSYEPLYTIDFGVSNVCI
eukprot:CFRG7417T1